MENKATSHYVSPDEQCFAFRTGSKDNLSETSLAVPCVSSFPMKRKEIPGEQGTESIKRKEIPGEQGNESMRGKRFQENKATSR